MTKNFNFATGTGVVIGTVARIPSDEYFFVQNGEPAQIFCHRNQCGTLGLTSGGRIVLKQDEPCEYAIGDRVALIRESDDRNDRAYTRASSCVPAEDWFEYSWATQANMTFRAFAINHRVNGQFQGNTRKDVKVAEDLLINLVKTPRVANVNDPLGPHYVTMLGTQKLSYDVRWERLEADGTWTECGDPRPIN